MRILHLLSERGYSGGEHQLAYLLEHLNDCGHESIFVLNPSARFEAKCRELGNEVRFVRMRNDADVVALWKLRRLFREIEPDLIHFACSRSHKIGAHASVGLRHLAPRVATRRMDYPLGRSRYRRWLYGRAVQAVVAVSEGVRREVLAVGVPEDHVHCIHDGVDAERLRDLRTSEHRARTRAQHGIADDALVGLTSASLHARKGQDLLIAALEGLGDREIVWLIAGDGPERAALEDRARAAGMLDPNAGRRVLFLGDVRPVDPLLATADLFCLPSRKEGLGVALLEAMAAGLACVGTGVGGILEAIENERSGLLFEVEDASGLRSALCRLVDDAELRGRLGAAAQQRVQDHFDIRRMCSRTEELYSRLAGNSA